MSLFRRTRRHDAPQLPVLRTERLVLRNFDPNDAVDVFSYAQSDKVGPMAGWPPHKTVEDSRRVVERFIREGEVWAIVEKHTGHVIGSIGLHRDQARKVEGARELGYALGEKHWGQGYACEACDAVLRYAFEELHSPVVSVGHFPTNGQSRRVIKKLGFHYDGTLRRAWLLPDGGMADVMTYSLLDDEYRARGASK